MSWLQSLIQTYDNCFEAPQFSGDDALPPIDHIEQQALLEVVLDGQGNLRRASVVPKENTLLPVTEKSAGRTSGAVAHPLCDKLRYVAADYGSGSDHQLYLDGLRAWAAAANNPKLNTILKYVERGRIVEELVDAGILTRSADGRLETRWVDGLSPLAKLLTADPKTKERDQGDALIRWRVEIPGELETAVWKDTALHNAWTHYNGGLPATRGLCLATGTEENLAFNHPKGIRRAGDGAKLISANDSPFDRDGKPRQHGFTFVGRFTRIEEAYGLGSHATQKAHNALRWLIKRQGTRVGEMAVVAWSPGGEPVPPIAEDTPTIAAWFDFETKAEQKTEILSPQSAVRASTSYNGYAGQLHALRLRKKVLGFLSELTPPKSVVVMALDSATPGRVAVVYYRELQGSELLHRIEAWHNELAWPQHCDKNRRFVGAPSPRDIAEAAYGSRVDGKLLKTTVGRLLPCIVDGSRLPRDLMIAAVQRATRRAALETWEFERVLGVACSLVRGMRKDEEYRMSLEVDRTSRSYLFGRLLATAEGLESYSLYLAGEGRDTTAERLMQRFADHPAETWRTIELALRPYMQRLRSRRPSTLGFYKDLLDSIETKFQGDDFVRSGRLEPEFLLGYHCQRAALPQKNAEPHETSEDNSPNTV